jgi:hypothetical protein
MSFAFLVNYFIFTQENVTIVDSPGVGESEEMTEKLVKYLPKAVAFIYIVNSANAGGIQEDTVYQRIFVYNHMNKLPELLQKLKMLEHASTCNKMLPHHNLIQFIKIR